MERRTFLSRLLAATATAVTVGQATACRDTGAFNVTTLGEPALLPPLGTEGVRALGKQYMAETSGEAERSAIEAALLADMRTLRGLPWNPDPDFSALVREDFRQGHTLWLDGWLLSRNEARRLALFALSAPS